MPRYVWFINQSYLGISRGYFENTIRAIEEGSGQLPVFSFTLSRQALYSLLSDQQNDVDDSQLTKYSTKP